MPGEPSLYVFFGLIASGKSTLAEAWAKTIGASYYNSDRLRKELAGLAVNATQQESFNAGIYSAEFSRRTYDALLAHADADLSRQCSVVLDGSYQAKVERTRITDIARRHNTRLIFVLCRCPEPLMKERMAQRALDPTAVSDGRWEIYLHQKARFETPNELLPTEFISIDTNAPVETLLSRLNAMIKEINAATHV